VLVRVLGSAAGGGFPQWNCNCTNCAGVRAGQLRARPRTQSSIAVSDDGAGWVLFNASPDIRIQIESFPPLRPSRKIRDTGIAAIILVDSQIDHATGLLLLREGAPLRVYCSDMVYQDLTTGFPVLKILENYCGVERHRVGIEGEDSIFSVPETPNLQFKAVALDSKAPPYSPHRYDPHPGDTIGVCVEDSRSGKSLFYAPALGKVDSRVLELMAQADCLLVDGTFWQDDELAVQGISDKRALDMGHLPQWGPGGMIEVLRKVPKPRKVLIHINNTNPILREDSAERAILEREGIEVAFDGMEIVL